MRETSDENKTETTFSFKDFVKREKMLTNYLAGTLLRVQTYQLQCPCFALFTINVAMVLNIKT